MKQGTKSQCSGTTQRDGVGREVGGRFRIGGTHVHPWLIHVNIWQKPPQYCKVISLQLKLILKKDSKLSSAWAEKKFIKVRRVAQRISTRAWASGTGDHVLFGTTLKFPWGEMPGLELWDTDTTAFSANPELWMLPTAITQRLSVWNSSNILHVRRC